MLGQFCQTTGPVVFVSRFFQRAVFVLSSAIFASLAFGFAGGLFGWFGVHAGSAEDGAYKQIHVYSEVLKKIQTDYVTDPNMGDVTTGALHGLLEALDADSSYLTPAEYTIYKQQTSQGTAQFGLTVSKRYGYAIVVNVLPGSPAEKEHLSDGDVIESIGPQSTRDLSLATIRLLLEGKAGSELTLSIVRHGKSDPDKVTLTRAVLNSPALTAQMLESNSILSLKPGTLTAQRVDEIAARIRTEGKGKKILLDLRDTSGVDLQQGLRLANLFLKQGTMATLEGQKYPRQVFTASAAQFLSDSPLVVLVNRGTYGAGEIAAGALGDAKRADVVGERTFGEGSVQKTIELQNGAALLLTVAKYATPGGKKIEDEAVMPTVVVGPSSSDDEEEDATEPSDAIYKKGLEVLKAKAA